MAGVNPIVAGLACRCPNCGKGPLFEGFLKVRDHCGACGFDLRKADSGDGPTVFIILIGGGAVCFGALISDVALHPPLWLELTFWPIAAIVLCLALLRPFKGVMVAMQFHNQASEARNDL